MHSALVESSEELAFSEEEENFQNVADGFGMQPVGKKFFNEQYFLMVSFAYKFVLNKDCSLLGS